MFLGVVTLVGRCVVRYSSTKQYSGFQKGVATVTLFCVVKTSQKSLTSLIARGKTKGVKRNGTSVTGAHAGRGREVRRLSVGDCMISTAEELSKKSRQVVWREKLRTVPTDNSRTLLTSS